MAKLKKIEVEIAACDIERADKGSLDNCVLARAISRVTKEPWRVGYWACWPVRDLMECWRIEGLSNDVARSLDEGDWRTAKRSVGRRFSVAFVGFGNRNSPVDPAVGLGLRRCTLPAM